MRSFIETSSTLEATLLSAVKDPAYPVESRQHGIDPQLAADHGQVRPLGSHPVARLPALKALAHRLVAAIVLIGRTKVACTEMARLGLAAPDSSLTRPEGSPFA